MTISANKSTHISDKNWLLNLDMVQQQTGKILAYNYVTANELCGSIIGFDNNVVLYSKLRPNLNKVVLPDKYGFCTSELLPLLPDSKQLNREYLAWFLRSDSFVNWAVTKTAGAKMPRLGTKELLSKEIPLPDLPTQRRIADTLDKVSEGIGLCRKMLGELDLMVKAKFVEMFGNLSSPECQWKKCHLIEVCANKDDIKCGPFGTQLNKEEYLPEGVAVWEIPQINSQFAKKPTHFLTEQKAEQLSAYSLLPGDIAMSRKGNVGKCAIFPSCFAPGIIHSDVLRIRVDSAKVNPIFMMSQLHYSGAVTRQIEIVSSGAIMAGINVTKLKQIIVHVPPYAIQNRFAAFVTEIDKSKLTIQKILDKMELEKLALMQEYFG